MSKLLLRINALMPSHQLSSIWISIWIKEHYLLVGKSWRIALIKHGVVILSFARHSCSWRLFSVIFSDPFSFNINNYVWLIFDFEQQNINISNFIVNLGWICCIDSSQLSTSIASSPWSAGSQSPTWRNVTWLGTNCCTFIVKVECNLLPPADWSDAILHHVI